MPRSQTFNLGVSTTLASCAARTTLVLSIALGVPSSALAALRVHDLRCEWRTRPLGIDVLRPRLSWIATSDQNGETQTAYRIVVHGRDGLAWDSGRVESSENANIEYAGRPLRPREQLTWHVTIWGKDGKPARSPTATWEMGLLSPGDWGGARWIGRPLAGQDPPPSLVPDEMRWIWYPEGDPSRQAPAGRRTLRRIFEVTGNSPIKRAALFVACDGRCAVHLNSTHIGDSPGNTHFSHIAATSALRPGRNQLDLLVHNGGEAAGGIGQLVIEWQDGHLTRLSTDGDWQAARAEEPETFVPVVVVAKLGEGEYWRTLRADAIRFQAPAAPAFLRREFVLEQAPMRARIYATALGIYEIFLNGKRVGRDHFAPGWTSYDKRLQYQTYDVTHLLMRGTNALGAILGDGWYMGRLGWAAHLRGNYGTYPLRFFARLVVDYPDGKQVSLISDEHWRALPEDEGPLRAADFFSGEAYDARLEANIRGWDRSHFSASSWLPVDVKDEVRNLVAEPGAAVRVFEERTPVRMTEPTPRVFVFDMGQNMVGWVRIRVRGPRGTTVRIRHAEMLNPDGTLYTESLRSADSTDWYTLRGGALETWEPRFTFHGFRYVELSGLLERPSLASVVGRIAHSDIPRTGTLRTSSSLLNQLQHNIDWGQRGNFLSVPTDCPQRDERLGWMGDAQIFARTACFNRDVATFFTKWVRDIADAQAPSGAFPDYAPAPPEGAPKGAPAWGDAGVIVPWAMYECYGDRRLLAEHYPNMVAWVEYIRGHNPDLLWKNERGADYGDWLSLGADTDKELIGTAFFAWSTHLVAQSAAALGNPTDADRYTALFERIRAAFNRAYVLADGSLKSDTQTAYALALRFGLLEGATRARAAEHLAAAVARHGGHLSTGFVGVAHLLPALSLADRWDIAYSLLLKESFPSWGYSIKHGATTIWERWDGFTTDRGFQTPSMNSFNHYSFGSVGEWMYAHVGGIQPVTPGYARIRIAPRPGPGLLYAEANYLSVRGPIRTRWRRVGSRFSLDVEIPVGARAEVRVPGQIRTWPLGGSTPVLPAPEPNAAWFEVDSGRYRFSSVLGQGFL